MIRGHLALAIGFLKKISVYMGLFLYVLIPTPPQKKNIGPMIRIGREIVSPVCGIFTESALRPIQSVSRDVRLSLCLFVTP